MTGSDADGDDDFVWDDEESDALRRAVMDATLVASADSMREFLEQADNEVRLSATEEAELIRRIETGRHNESKRLRQDGDDARDELFKAHQHLVVSVAKRYTGRGTAFLDLVQVGGVGLMRAVEKFDSTKGYRFSTYATWWIRQAITRTMAP